MILFYSENISSTHFELAADEAKHCSRVLRKSVGDEIHVTDCNGGLFLGEIEAVSKNSVSGTVLEQLEKQELPVRKAVAIAPTKNISRFEWFLEKATEIGISEIYPILTSRSERKVIKPERLQKILLAATKQSMNLHMPKLHPLQKLESVLEQADSVNKFIAHCMKPNLPYLGSFPSRDGLLLIGPEGDFTAEEVQKATEKDFLEVSLGQSRYRTETAGIVGVHLMNLPALTIT